MNQIFCQQGQACNTPAQNGGPAVAAELSADFQQLRRKQIATVVALLALRGYEALELLDGGFVVCQWKLGAEVEDDVGHVAKRCLGLASLEEFAREVGALA